MGNHLTDRNFWVNYWERKIGLATSIPENYLFHAELKKLISKNEVKSSIELGGFPGYYAVFLKKYLHLDVTLLDYFVHLPIINDLLKTNGLNEHAISIIETDLFNYTPEKKYDLVLSCGLIEHFNDTADIIKRHIAFIKTGGTLFITLPNFHAINGWLQKTFDKENFDKHNLNSMNPKYLESICKNAGLVNVKACYTGGFSVWLEDEKQKPFHAKLLKRILWFTGKVLSKILPFESKRMSPYILLVAQKP